MTSEHPDYIKSIQIIKGAVQKGNSLNEQERLQFDQAIETIRRQATPATRAAVQRGLQEQERRWKELHK